ncbi:MAG: DNA-directed RNA polymerase subunit alpha [Bdellovibrionales bacterium]|nr:DNA-directed RNA polymerase subunit alpha [Bdellovibrionales bacterium]MCB0332344.1 DNA-directed RNA polymerase subunit alpha [Bdellovibrionales bacterium]
MIKPKRIEVEAGTLDDRYGKFVAEPLERGFGLTVGNSLRRILLSSLQGSAITSVQIDGVMHEFSTIPGVLEDVTQIVLNLKEVVTLLEDKDEAYLTVEATGPCEVTASMLTGDPSVQILNPELKIATLSEGSTLRMTVTVKVGRGYVSAERNKVEGAPMGTIFVDSVFSPIRRVNHVVTNARVGQRTDYDKLTMEIWTDGSIDARSAVAQAAHILVDQLNLFVGEGFVVEEEQPVIEEPKKQLNENLFRRIEEIELSVRSANCLENADIKYIGELVQRTEAEMLRTKNFGRKSLNEIKEILGAMGLSLGLKLEDFPERAQLDSMHREQVEQ